MRNGTSRQVTLLMVVDSISPGFTTSMPAICISSMLVLVFKCRFAANCSHLRQINALPEKACVETSPPATKFHARHFFEARLKRSL